MVVPKIENEAQTVMVRTPVIYGGALSDSVFISSSSHYSSIRATRWDAVPFAWANAILRAGRTPTKNGKA